MHYVIELWTPKQPWLDLSPAERQSFVEQLEPMMERHEEMGIEILAMAKVDEDTDHRTNHHYFSVLQVPDEATAKRFEADLRESGWYLYFDQQNARGRSREAKDIIGEHISM